jgi:hypothetical protein
MKAIAREVGVSVSSVSLWVRDIELTEEQLAKLAARNPRLAAEHRGGERTAARYRAERCRHQEAGRAMARKGDDLHRSGCMLFWAEGSKRRSAVIFTNSDADMLHLFVRFLRECYGVGVERLAFSVNCHLNNGLSLTQIESWWLERLDLPATCLRRATVNRASSASRYRRNVLTYGTARIVVHSAEIAQSIYGAIQEYAGIERPEWVDLPAR